MRALVGGILFLIALPFLWFGSAFAYQVLSERSYRFRVAVEVATPEGIRTGSSVVHFATRLNPGWIPPGTGTNSRVKGEAVFVDLGPGPDGHPRHLIALLAHGSKGDNPNYYLLPARAFFPVPNHQGTLAFGGYADRLDALPIGARAEVVGSNIPTLVTFSNLADPRTARVVEPDHLGSEFGRGYELKRIWIEKVPIGWWPANVLGISGEPVTSVIEAKLAWWDKPLPWMIIKREGRTPTDARPIDHSLYRLMTTHYKRSL